MASEIYRIDMRLCATAYIRATSEEDAAKKAKALKDLSPAILSPDGRHHMADVPISGLDFDDPKLPDVSFSPAMTIVDVEENAEPELAGE